MSEPWRPDWTVHPGEILREALDERGITQAALARSMGLTLPAVNHICTGTRGIGPIMAVRLERALIRPSAEFWMRLQADYDLHHARAALDEPDTTAVPSTTDP